MCEQSIGSNKLSSSISPLMGTFLYDVGDGVVRAAGGEELKGVNNAHFN